MIINFDNISKTQKQYNDLLNTCVQLINNNKNIFLLFGDLGTGKTFFTQSLLERINIKEDVTSPTFSLLNIYSVNDLQIYHYDLYRIKNSKELIDLDIHNAVNAFLTIVEWPEIASKFFANYKCRTVDVHISYNGNNRNYQIIV